MGNISWWWSHIIISKRLTLIPSPPGEGCLCEDLLTISNSWVLAGFIALKISNTEV